MTEVGSLTAVNKPVHFKRFRSSETVISRFVARHTMLNAAFWALIFGIFVISKATGIASTYPTEQVRAKFAASFSNNIGINALIGSPHNLTTIAGLTEWNCLGVIILVVSIWAFLLATKRFRGEEEAGRAELFQSGQTTARGAAVNSLIGLACSLVVMYIISSIGFISAGLFHSVDYSVGATLFFGLAVISAAALFMVIGFVTSQLMPTRARAVGLAAIIFGIFFLIRATADVTSAHWLLDISPLGWIEKIHPLIDRQPVWLLPMLVLIIILTVIGIWLAGRRDLGDSIFADSDSAKPHTGLLSSNFGASIRLTRGATLSWLLAIIGVTFFYAILTKSVTQAFNASPKLSHDINLILHSQKAAAVAAYIGFIFLMTILLLMLYVASAVSTMRNDEAEGYLDNLLVRPVSRLQWLRDRLCLILLVIILATGLTTLLTWVTTTNQGISAHSMLLAGLNCLPAAIFTLGIAVLGLGFTPRLTSVIAYSVIAWSFMIQMIGSGIKLNHWLLDTSVLYHINLAPAANPNWTSAVILGLLGIAAAILGAWRFNNRDLQNE